MSAPKRIQLHRTKGWRKPEGTVLVSRPSLWGNPFTVASCIEVGFAGTDGPFAQSTKRQANTVCAEAFGSVMRAGRRSPWWFADGATRFDWMAEHLHELRGYDLACWCPLDAPCHADVLLELANAPLPTSSENT